MRDFIKDTFENALVSLVLSSYYPNFQIFIVLVEQPLNASGYAKVIPLEDFVQCIGT